MEKKNYPGVFICVYIHSIPGYFLCFTVCITHFQRSRTQWVCWHQTSLCHQPLSLSLSPQYQHPAAISKDISRYLAFYLDMRHTHCQRKTHLTALDVFNTKVNIWKYLCMREQISGSRFMARPSSPTLNLKSNDVQKTKSRVTQKLFVASLCSPVLPPVGRWQLLQAGPLVPSFSSSVFGETCLKNVPSCGTSSRWGRRIPSPQGHLYPASVSEVV